MDRIDLRKGKEIKIECDDTKKYMTLDQVFDDHGIEYVGRLGFRKNWRIC